jgi:ketosteroid isomerase-like protein
MSDDDLQVVKDYLERWNRGSFDMPFDAVDPSVTIDWSESNAPYSGVYSGHQGWLDLFSEIRDAFQHAEVEVHEYIVAGQRIAVHSTAHLRGRHDVAVDASSTMVWTFRDGKIVSVRLYQQHADALKAIS